MLQINDVIPLKWKLLVEGDVLSTTTTTTETRIRAMKEKRGLEMSAGQIHLYCTMLPRDSARVSVPRHSPSRSFEGNARSTGRDPIRGFSSLVFRHSSNAWGFLPTFSSSTTRDEGASLSYGIKKRLSRFFSPFWDGDRRLSRLKLIL